MARLGNGADNSAGTTARTGTQNSQFGVAWATTPAGVDRRHNGGNVRVYQEFLAPSAISAASGQTSGSAVCLCSAAVGANAHTCRVADSDWQLGRVYFLAFLNPSRVAIQPEL